MSKKIKKGDIVRLKPGSKLEEEWFEIVKGRNDMKGRVLDLYREVVDEFI